MINKISFTVKGDYREMTLCRDNGSRKDKLETPLGKIGDRRERA